MERLDNEQREYLYVAPNKLWIPLERHAFSCAELVLRDLPIDFKCVTIRIEDDCFHVYTADDILLRELEPLRSRKMQCYFEDPFIIEFTMEELERLLKEMFGELDGGGFNK